MEALLNISGEDAVTINRKNKPRISTTLSVIFLFAANRFLGLPDRAQALARRIRILSFDTKFSSPIDHDLSEKLKLEMPGITAWALVGLRRLRANHNRFTTPVSSLERLKEHAATVSEPMAFIEECLICADNASVTENQSLDLARKFIGSRRAWTASKEAFYRELKQSFAVLDRRLGRDKSGRDVMYKGFSLKPDAIAQYSGGQNINYH